MTDKQMHEGEQTRMWDYFQNEGVESFSRSRPRLKHIVGQIDPGLKLLNIGVGGAILEELALGKGIDVHSLDPSERTIEKLRHRFDVGEKAQTGYSENIPFEDGMFDVVVMSEVLEHLDNNVMEQTLVEVHRVLRADGQFIGTVPARENLADQQVICPCCGESFHRWGHRRSFDAVSVRRLLEKSFVLQEVSERYFVYWAGLNWKGRVTALSKLMLAQVGLHGANENIFFIAKKL